MTKADKNTLQNQIDILDSVREAINRIKDSEDPADVNVEYLVAAIDEITEAIGNIEWVV